MNGQKDYDDEAHFMALADQEKWRMTWAILRDIQERVSARPWWAEAWRDLLKASPLIAAIATVLVLTR